MDCSEIHRFLHAYIDLEFDEREEIEFELHLGQCRSCREEVNYYRALRRTLRQKLPNRVAPLRLETMIRETLNTEERIQRGWFSLSMATIGAFVFALGTFLWSSHVHEPVAPSMPGSAMTQPRSKAPSSVTLAAQQDPTLFENSLSPGTTGTSTQGATVFVGMGSHHTSTSYASKPTIDFHECNPSLGESSPMVVADQPTHRRTHRRTDQPTHQHTPWCTGRHIRSQYRVQAPSHLISATYSSNP